jgi:hypothetical protein
MKGQKLKKLISRPNGYKKLAARSLLKADIPQ